MTAAPLPAVGIGTAAFGRLYAPVSARMAAATLESARAAGIDYIDTAPGYGDGLSEQRIGRHLAGAGPRPVISTKVGTVVDALPPIDLDDPDAVTMQPGRVHRGWTVADVRRSISDSLNRLGIDAIDIALLHDPETDEDQAATTAYEALRQLRAEGVVGAIGVGCNHVDVAIRFVRRLDLDYILIAGRYTLLDHSALDDLLPRALDRDTKIIAAGVFNSGILASGRADDRFHYRPAPEHVRERLQQLVAACARHDVELAAVAAQFPSGHPAVASTVVGVRSPDEVLANVEALRRPIPATFWDELRERALLPANAPVPSGPPLNAGVAP
ncbi:aldo/keto reductase [Jiangella alba]|uniref:D-threo-aldose 1-dehydrogenase n=1 Tax=Jiangella alba TaxID=561176 RepID=A0A1H5LEK2_9ACTN|nr:aldo/keto reductase [Jiangella alba]SEE74977.1 D-threo-aldose 1-dehydrogenase [Jiangella alba]